MNAATIALVCTGGAVGAVVRYWVSRGLALWQPTSKFPLPTLFVNLTGSALLGVVFAVADPDVTQLIDAPLVLLLGVGFCGAYTTFSSFCTDTVTLIPQSGWLATAYVVATVVGSVVAFSVPFAGL